MLAAFRFTSVVDPVAVMSETFKLPGAFRSPCTVSDPDTSPFPFKSRLVAVRALVVRPPFAVSLPVSVVVPVTFSVPDAEMFVALTAARVLVPVALIVVVVTPPFAANAPVSVVAPATFSVPETSAFPFRSSSEAVSFLRVVEPLTTKLPEIVPPVLSNLPSASAFSCVSMMSIEALIAVMSAGASFSSNL